MLPELVAVEEKEEKRKKIEEEVQDEEQEPPPANGDLGFCFFDSPVVGEMRAETGEVDVEVDVEEVEIIANDIADVDWI